MTVNRSMAIKSGKRATDRPDGILGLGRSAKERQVAAVDAGRKSADSEYRRKHGYAALPDEAPADKRDSD